MHMLEVKNLVKKFNDLTAVNNISFEVKEGEIFGLLGPNGAGKTTTLNLILGILDQTSGQIKVNGMDNRKEGKKIKQIISLMTQETIVEPDLTARQNLELFAKLYHLDQSVIESRIENALKEAELTEFADKRTGTFSGGMQRRLALVKTLIHEPKLIILDEPTTGLDIQNRVKMWDHIKKLSKDKVTVLLTTQYLEEADALCDRIAIIDHGRIIAMGTPSELRSMLGGYILEIITKPEIAGKVAEVVKKQLGDMPNVNIDKITIGTNKDPLEIVEKVAEMLKKEKLQVLSIGVHLPTMDDIFLKLTGKETRDTTGEMKSNRVIIRR
ncbi:MAG: ABC transporter ATP-binding protein [Candidatus Micrarchaeia archaeon]